MSAYTTSCYQDPLPVLGKKVVPPPVLGKLPGEHDWVDIKDKPGFQRNVRDDKIRTNTPLPPGAAQQAQQPLTPPVLKPFVSPTGRTVVTSYPHAEVNSVILGGVCTLAELDFSKLEEQIDTWPEALYGSLQAIQPDVFLPGVPGIPSSFGWRKDKPEKDGVYYGTDSKNLTKKVDKGPEVIAFELKKELIRGEWFYYRTELSENPQPCQRDIFWHVRPVA